LARLHPYVRIALTGAVVLLLAVPAAQAQYTDFFGKNKVQYRDFDWQIYHSTHFDVYYYEEEAVLLEKVVSFAESAYDDLSRSFDYQIQNPIPLIFYATHSAFEQNNIILNFIPEGVGAFASPVRNRMVLPVDLPDPELMGLVRHELTHIFQYEILFGGSLARGLANNPPLWFMEGMASYMAKDESTFDRMYLRDAVVNDLIPPITQTNVSGFFAYRFGHAAFDYIEERWGDDGFLDFMYEFRNTLGSRTDRAIQRTFKMEPEDFDRDFRRWLRQKYLPQLVETGEPGDFGRPFRAEGGPSQETSPVASPSGDLVASFSSYKRDLDIVLFDTEKRRLVKNLTKGLSTDFQYFTAQALTAGRGIGSDLAFSPDGNQVAAFAKRDKNRSLVLVNVLKGGVNRIIDLEVEQPQGLAWSPDGRTIAFAGNQNSQFDLFTIDVDTGAVTNLTNDQVFDGGPAFSADGRWLAYSAVIDQHAQLFRLDLQDPSKRYQLTRGDSNNFDVTYSPSGDRVYFTSDRDGVDNIYSLDLGSGQVKQYTDVVTGCFQPTILQEPDGTERLVYTGYWKGRYDLYVTDVDEPVAEPETLELSDQPVVMGEMAVYEPDIQVAVDEANQDEYGGFNFFLEDAQGFVGVDDDSTLVGRAIITFSDYLGDRRFIGIFDSQNSFSNFDLRYLNLRNRWQWQIQLFDQREFYTLQDRTRGDIERIEEAFEQTGVIGSLIYPFGLNTRVEFGAGYVLRKFTQPVLRVGPDGLPEIDPRTGGAAFDFVSIDDSFPLLTSNLVGDSALYASYGPISGSRWRLGVTYAPDFDESGTLFTTVQLDARKYIPITRRSNFALRLYGGASDGNAPRILSFGGLDTLRGVPYRSLSGDRVAFANIEYRFPLIDLLATPIFNFQGIRARVFLDIGTAYFSDDPTYEFYDSDEDRLVGGIAAYGFGISFRLFGLNLNWDFSKLWDLDTSASSFATDFYIGARF